MKKIILYLLSIASFLAIAGCTEEYDDTKVWDSINSLESRMSSMETIMNAYKNNLLIKSVDQTSNGYVITFTDGSKATIANGKDGKDGVDGKDGENGKDGVDGQDGKDGKDGEDGKDGADGKDGVDGDTLIESIVIYENNVTFNLTDGRTFSIPLYSSLTVEFDSDDLKPMLANSERDIHYTVHSYMKDIKVEVVSSADIKAKVVPDSKVDSIGAIHVVMGSAIDEYSKVVIFVSNGEKMIMRSISFEEAGLLISNGAIKKVPAIGKDVKLEFLTNVECQAVIPDSVKSWISIVPETKAMHNDTITVSVSANTGHNRSAKVMVQSMDGALNVVYSIEQRGELGEDIPNEVPSNEIWYVSSSNEKISDIIKGKTFDANIVFHDYENGKFIIRFDKPVTYINCYSIPDRQDITELYLPDNIETIKNLHFAIGLKTLRIPAKLKSMGINLGIYQLENMESFTGAHVSDDGKCVIINGVMYAFASKGLTEYTFPDGISSFAGKGFFADNDVIEKVTFPEGITEIPSDFFLGCGNLKFVYFPSTLEKSNPNIFNDCPSLEGLYGSEDLFTSDHRCMINKQDGETNLTFFAGHGLTEYSIPEGITDLGSSAFASDELQRITFPGTIEKITGYRVFSKCSNLEAAFGPYITEDHLCFVNDSILYTCVAQKNFSTYRIPDNVNTIRASAFEQVDCPKTITMGDQVRYIGSSAFEECENLETIVLSAGLKELGSWAFSRSLKSIYFRSPLPPATSDRLQNYNYDSIKVYVPKESIQIYKCATPWKDWKDFYIGYDYGDLSEFYPDYYFSTDFSKDGEATTLQRANAGSGIDIVIMGDAYSDRQISDGTYEKDMNSAYESFFSEEPFKTFKDLFNVYYVTAVSVTEGYDQGNTALNGYFGNGTHVGGNDETCIDYAEKALPGMDINKTLIIVVMNSTRYGGTCYIYYTMKSDYGLGKAIAFCPKGWNDEIFKEIVQHEACGHGFGKLADEYSYSGTIPQKTAEKSREDQSEYGYWKNVDFTDDLNAIRWSYFINDARYANEGLGAFEGAMIYAKGVWRPTKNSIMRQNVGGFNAPSREAIYYRIHKQAYGDSWQYNYEDFVNYDEINRKNESSAQSIRRVPARNDFVPLYPPVLIREDENTSKE